MATYLDEIRNDTLYRRKFFLPINEKDKRHNSLIFLLSNSFMGSYELRNNPSLHDKLIDDSINALDGVNLKAGL